MITRRGRRRRVEIRQQAGVVALAVVVGTLAGIRATPAAPHARTVSRRAVAAASRPIADRTVLFGHVGSSGVVDFLAVIGLHSNGRQGVVLFLPPPTAIDVPSLDVQKFSDIASLGGRPLLRLAVMNALNVRVDEVDLFDDAQLATLLSPTTKFNVDFSSGVRVDDHHGSLAYPAGRVSLFAADAQRLVLGSESGGTIDHLVTVQAVIEGWLARLRTGAVAATTVVASPRAGRIFARLAHAKVEFDTLPVESVDAGGSERFQFRDADVRALIGSRFGFAQLRRGSRPRVELLNGVGIVGVTPRVAAQLIPAGAHITLTGNVAGFAVTATRVVYYRDADLPTARAYARRLGIGLVGKGGTPISVVDITVVIGADYLRRNPR